MKCTLSICKTLVTILFTFMLTNEFDCCSDNTFDIISLMSQDSNFKQNPCYIKWKADQDRKLQQIWSDREELEKIIARNNQIRYENEARERENRHNSYRTTVIKKKESPVLMIVGIIAGVIVGICCCLGCTKGQENLTACETTNTLHPGASAILTSSATGNPPILSTINANNLNLIVSGMKTRRSSFTYPECVSQNRYTADPQQLTETNAPLLTRGMIIRQNSLPSYEDAIKMPLPRKE